MTEEELRHREMIRNLVVRFSIHSDRGRFSDVAACFTADGKARWHTGRMRFLSRFHSRLDFAQPPSLPAMNSVVGGDQLRQILRVEMECAPFDDFSAAETIKLAHRQAAGSAISPHAKGEVQIGYR
jgi:SnoaL-like domain